jgi:hypothetical protein
VGLVGSGIRHAPEEPDAWLKERLEPVGIQEGEKQ